MMIMVDIDADDGGGEKNVGSLGWMLLLSLRSGVTQVESSFEKYPDNTVAVSSNVDYHGDYLEDN